MRWRTLSKAITTVIALASQSGCLGLFGSRLSPPPEPKPNTAAKALPDVPPSTLSARFVIPIGWIRDSIDAYLPRESVGTDAWAQTFEGNDKIQTQHAIYRRGLTPVADNAPSDRALWQNAIEFRLRARQRLASKWKPETSCAWEPHSASVATLVRAKLAIMTSFNVRPDWTLEPASRLVGVSTDACPIQLPDVSISDVLNRLVSTHFTNRLAAIDSAIRARLDFTEIVTPLWTRAQAPIAVDKGAWLLVNPRKARLAPLVVRNDTLFGTIGIVGVPSLWVGAKPPPRPSLPLPKLDIGPVDSVSVIRTAIVLSDAAIRRAIADTLLGMRISRKVGPFRVSTKVTDVGFFAAGDTAVVKVTLAGRVRGDVWLMGVPMYDPATRTFMLKDVALTAASSDFLSKAAFTAARSAIERSIERSARIDLGPQLDSLARRLGDVADQDFGPLRLRVAVKEVSPVGVFRVKDGFATVVNLRGSARITGREP
jgi:hypothetical protein